MLVEGLVRILTEAIPDHTLRHIPSHWLMEADYYSEFYNGSSLVPPVAVWPQVADNSNRSPMNGWTVVADRGWMFISRHWMALMWSFSMAKAACTKRTRPPSGIAYRLVCEDKTRYSNSLSEWFGSGDRSRADSAGHD